MIPVLLAKTKTSDGITLEGIYVPPIRKAKTALIWIHGLASRFSSGQTLIKELSAACAKNGIGYFKFNNRGHDIVNKDALPKGLSGSGFEKFEECILDIRAIVKFAKKLGYRDIILAGHSTGANKILYYLYQTRDRSIRGLALINPISDIAAEKKRIGEKRLVKILQVVRRLSQNSLIPQKYGIYTARRYLSLYMGGSPEDVFPYHNPKAKWTELKTARVPLIVILGSCDEYLDRPAKHLLELFRENSSSTKSFRGIIIKGAKHSFRGKEKELSASLIFWIKDRDS